MIDPSTLRRGDIVRVVDDLTAARHGDQPALGKLKQQGKIFTIDKVERSDYLGFKTKFSTKVTLEEDGQFWWFGEELENGECDFEIDDGLLSGFLDGM